MLKSPPEQHHIPIGQGERSKNGFKSLSWSHHIDVGRKGEELAAGFLVNLGYRILDRNWRLGRHEIDVVAEDGEIIVIVEVKTRCSNLDCEPEEAVNSPKQQILIHTANAWMRYHRASGEIRFDVVAVILHSGGIRINHIKDAFSAFL